MSLVVYADFDCPECYTASRRIDALQAVGVPVDWRAIEHEPSLSRVAVPTSPNLQEQTTGRFERLQEMLLPTETLPWTMPGMRPRTGPAVSAYAQAYGARVADDVRRILFDLYWAEGIDIGSPTALYSPLVGPMLRGVSDLDPVRDHGCAVSVTGDPVSTAAYRQIDRWRTQWHELGSPALPLLVVDGAQLDGLDAIERLGETIVERAADPSPQLEDPRRYPSLQVRPDARWVSETGGRWRHTLQVAGRR